MAASLAFLAFLELALHVLAEVQAGILELPCRVGLQLRMWFGRAYLVEEVVPELVDPARVAMAQVQVSGLELEQEQERVLQQLDPW